MGEDRRVLEVELAELRKQIAGTRRRRQDAQRHLLTAGTIEASIAQTERDIDTMSDAEVTRLRASVAELTARLQQIWQDSDYYRVAIKRIAAGGADWASVVGGPALEQALAEEAVLRGQVADRLAEAGLPLRVPAPFDADLPDDIRRTDREEILKQVRQRSLERDLHSRRPTRRREKDEHAR